MVTRPAQHKGFTLIELMVTIAIAAILLTIGVPSLTSFFDRAKVIAAAEAVYSALQETKSEAISRSTDVHFVNNLTTSYGTTFNWAITTNSGCTLGDGDCTISIAGTDVENEFDNASFDDVQVKIGSEGAISFDGVRGASSDSVIYLQSPDGLDIEISVSSLGRVSICSNDVGSYKGCSS